MIINRQDWDHWKTHPVTVEWLKLLNERYRAYERLIPALIATGTDESIAQARVASGRHQELEDFINTEFEDMEEK